MFTETNPANDIRELLGFLERDDNDRYLYRGQTKDYDSLVPSAYRKWTSPEKKKHNVFAVNSEGFRRDGSQREFIRLTELNRLIAHFGIGLGNIFAQQYGISSECIDVTSNVKVAGFFATRKWPSYSHYSGSIDNSLGVIYRFPLIRFVSDLNGLDLTLSLAGMKHPDKPVPLWFMKYGKRSQFSEEELQRILSKHSHVEQTLFTQPVVVSYRYLEAFIQQFYRQQQEEKDEEGNHKGTFLTIPSLLRQAPTYNKPDFSPPRIALPSTSGLITDVVQMDVKKTRFSRQDGGFLQPSFTWKCTIPQEINIEYIAELKGHFSIPGYAIQDTLLGVEDLMAYPGIERFYFRHSDHVINDYELSFLWPDLDTDPFWKLIDHFVCLNNKSYLDSNQIAADDMKQGIVDRGFYT